MAAAALHFALWHRAPLKALGAIHAALLILPLSYFLALFVGVPYLYAMHRLGILNIGSMALGGLLLGLAVGFGIGVMLFPLWDWYARFFYLTLGGLCGLTIALAYWLIWFLSPGRWARNGRSSPVIGEQPSQPPLPRRQVPFEPVPGHADHRRQSDSIEARD